MRILVAVLLTAFVVIAGQRLLESAFRSHDQGAYMMEAFTLKLVVEGIEDYRVEHGNYPVACDWASLEVALGPQLGVKSSSLDEGMYYCSSGTSYVAAFVPSGPGPNLGGWSSPLVLSDGKWVSWPTLVPEEYLGEFAAFPNNEVGDSQSNNELNLTVTPLACARVAPAG